jgi:CDP-2,3-bis-(O-geranylgeranyl)-sn-glycerol synthase
MFLFQLFWLLLPAGFANMAAVFAARLLPQFEFPVDFGKKLRGKRIFGAHKTFRGVVAGTLVGGTIYLVQMQILSAYVNFFPNSQLATFNAQFHMWWLGFVLGFGALLGDMVKSFFKRQIHIAPGKSWIPFDQVDWIIGSLLLVAPLTNVTVETALIAAVIGFFLSLIVKFIGYLLKIDTTPI